MLSLSQNSILSSLSKISSNIPLENPINNEVLLVKGAKSDYINNNDIKVLTESFSKYKINEIPNSGHWVHAENPTAFINSINNFLKL